MNTAINLNHDRSIFLIKIILLIAAFLIFQRSLAQDSLPSYNTTLDNTSGIYQEQEPDSYEARPLPKQIFTILNSILFEKMVLVAHNDMGIELRKLSFIKKTLLHTVEIFIQSYLIDWSHYYLYQHFETVIFPLLENIIKSIFQSKIQIFDLLKSMLTHIDFFNILDLPLFNKNILSHTLLVQQSGIHQDHFLSRVHSCSLILAALPFLYLIINLDFNIFKTDFLTVIRIFVSQLLQLPDDILSGLKNIFTATATIFEKLAWAVSYTLSEGTQYFIDLIKPIAIFLAKCLIMVGGYVLHQTATYLPTIGAYAVIPLSILGDLFIEFFLAILVGLNEIKALTYFDEVLGYIFISGISLFINTGKNLIEYIIIPILNLGFCVTELGIKWSYYFLKLMFNYFLYPVTIQLVEWGFAVTQTLITWGARTMYDILHAGVTKAFIRLNEWWEFETNWFKNARNWSLYWSLKTLLVFYKLNLLNSGIKGLLKSYTHAYFDAETDTPLLFLIKRSLFYVGKQVADTFFHPEFEMYFRESAVTQ